MALVLSPRCSLTCSVSPVTSQGFEGHSEISAVADGGSPVLPLILLLRVRQGSCVIRLRPASPSSSLSCPWALPGAPGICVTWPLQASPSQQHQDWVPQVSCSSSLGLMTRWEEVAVATGLEYLVWGWEHSRSESKVGAGWALQCMTVILRN